MWIRRSYIYIYNTILYLYIIHNTFKPSLMLITVAKEIFKVTRQSKIIWSSLNPTCCFSCLLLICLFIVWNHCCSLFVLCRNVSHCYRGCSVWRWSSAPAHRHCCLCDSEGDAQPPRLRRVSVVQTSNPLLLYTLGKNIRKREITDQFLLTIFLLIINLFV